MSTLILLITEMVHEEMKTRLWIFLHEYLVQKDRLSVLIYKQPWRVYFAPKHISYLISETRISANVLWWNSRSYGWWWSRPSFRGNRWLFLVQDARPRTTKLAREKRIDDWSCLRLEATTAKGNWSASWSEECVINSAIKCRITSQRRLRLILYFWEFQDP